jgi:hypothetical protein
MQVGVAKHNRLMRCASGIDGGCHSLSSPGDDREAAVMGAIGGLWKFYNNLERMHTPELET